MKFEVHAAMFGYPVLALLIFAFVRPRRRAILAIFLLGFMFLPEIHGAEYYYKIPGLPPLTKLVNINLTALLAVAILDTRRLLMFRPGWCDLPMVVWCLAPFASSVSNDLGPYDGLVVSVGQILTWGVSHFVGRIYFSRLTELRELAVAMFIGGLIYIPLCLIEIRLSPQLHTWVYGFHPTAFDQTIRFGGFRPVVFMGHGLVVGLWMSMATLVGFWLWLSGTLRSIGGYSLLWLLIPLAITTVLVKSMGALVLLGVGMGVALATRKYPQRWILLALAALPLLYVGLRAPGIWSGEEMVKLSELVSDDRAGSLQFRLKNEDLLAEHALQRPVFGWGGWGRSRVYDDEGRDITITDGLWIIHLGYFGLTGLVALLGSFLLPVGVMTRQIPAQLWSEPVGAPAAMLATLLVLYLCDCIANATCNPVYMLAAGGLAGLTVVWKSPRLPHPRPHREEERR